MAKKPNGKAGKTATKKGGAKAAPGKSPAGTGAQTGAPFADPAAAAQAAQKAGQLPPELKKLQEQAERGHQPVTPETAGKPTVSQMLGEITWLLSMSPTHRYFFIADIEWLIMTPLLLSQFRLFRDPTGKPGGLALWAKLDEAGEKRLQEGATRLRPQDWNVGDRLWIVDLIDLTGNSQQNMIAEMKATVFKGQTFKYHRMEPDGRRVTVTEQDG